MRYIFTLAGISVYIESGFPLSIDDAARAFLKEDKLSSISGGTTDTKDFSVYDMSGDETPSSVYDMREDKEGSSCKDAFSVHEIPGDEKGPSFYAVNEEERGSFWPDMAVEEGSGPALRLFFKEVKGLPPYREEDVRYREPRRIYIGEGRTAVTYFSAFPGIPPYACVSRETVSDGYLEIRYLPGSEKYMNLGRNLIPLMDIETTMMEHDRLILHSSLISIQGKQQYGNLHSSFTSTRRKQGYGILFSAPSGTGKSTQAELWKEYKGADILNGDRAAVSRNKEGWTAYGLPIAGTSGIYRNESTPLRAIVALRQAETNRIRKIKGAEAYRYLYPETMIHRWDDAFEKKAGELLSTLIQEVPVLLLECRPDREAVELLEKTLREL